MMQKRRMESCKKEDKDGKWKDKRDGGSKETRIDEGRRPSSQRTD